MMKLITEELLDTVTSRAKENSRLRMNYNFMRLWMLLFIGC